MSRLTSSFILGIAVLGLSGPSVLTAQVEPTHFFRTFVGESSIGRADGPGPVARFHGPAAIAVGPFGLLYVADSQNHTIRRISGDGEVSTFAGRPGESGSADGTGAAARFNSPRALVVDGAGNLIVADTGNHTLRRVTPSGTVTTLAGAAGNPGSEDGRGSAARFNAPAAIAIDAAGRVFVGDRNSFTVRRVSPEGDVTTLAGTPGSFGFMDGVGPAATFTAIHGLGSDASGNLVLTQSHLIRRITPAGAVSIVAGLPAPAPYADGPGLAARFNTPVGVVLDAAGHAFIADAGNQVIRRLDLNNQVSLFAGIPGDPGHADGSATNATFAFPVGLTLDPAGNLFVADELNNNIRRITPSGMVTTVAGLSLDASAGFATGDGQGTAARLSEPFGVAVGPDDSLYIADTGHHVVRRVSRDGHVTTIGGRRDLAGFQDGPATESLFDSPTDVAVDAAGNVYVSDAGNFVVRKITPAGQVSTCAGVPGQPGGDGGAGTALSFELGTPRGLALDATGNLYLVDSIVRPGGGTRISSVRRVTPTGQLETLERNSTATGNYWDVAVSPSGEIFVTASGDIQQIAPSRPSVYSPVFSAPHVPARHLAFARDGTLYFTEEAGTVVARLRNGEAPVIVAGKFGERSIAPGLGTEARFNGAAGIAVDSIGRIYVACSDITANTVQVGTTTAAPQFTAQPTAQSVQPGAPVEFSATAIGAPASTYQWYLRNAPISGATTNTYRIPSATTADSGDYHVVATNPSGTATSAIARLFIESPPAPPPPPAPAIIDQAASGGGGSPSLMFLVLLASLAALRCRQSGVKIATR